MDSHRLFGHRHVPGVLTTFLALAALLALQVTQAAPAAAAPASSFNGTVVTSAGDPLADVCANAYDDDGDFLVGDRTGVDGTYRLEIAAGVQFRVQFWDCGPEPAHVEQWYLGEAEFDSADPITLGEVEELFAQQVVMALGGSVSGTVRSVTSGPLADICVFGVVGGGGGSTREVGSTKTRPDGTYTVTGVPAGEARVLFEDCKDVGPYVDQWYDGAASFGAATVIDVKEGEVLSGVDATLQRAAVVSGTVTGPDDQPLSDVCVQAVSADRVGGSDRTDDDGFYAMKVTLGGTYRVQFVDCDGDPTHAGRWFGGGIDPSTAQPIEVPAGGTVKNISTTLALGSGASLSGTATNIRGEAMTTACAVLYLADEFVEFRPVEPDGTYSFDGFGSGTYAVALIGCAEEDDDPDAQMTIPDPGDSGVAYQARWRGGAPLLLEDEGAPDPVLQGADLLTVGPGAAAEVDECFGCGAISLRLTPTNDSIVADFAANGLTAAGAMGAAADGPGEVGAEALGLEYSLSCGSDAPGVSSDHPSISGTSTPLVATDLDEGERYTCSVSATRSGLLVADSEVLGVSTVAPAAPMATPAPRSAAAGSPAAAAVPRPLSFAG